MSEKNKQNSKLEETANEAKDKVNEVADKVKEKADKHPKLKKWIGRLFWATIGVVVTAFAPALAERLCGKKETEPAVVTNEATDEG